MATPIAIAVVEHDGRFLIGQRPEGVPLAGLWEFPGGKMQAGETVEEAAVRECREETGLTIEALFQYPMQVHEYAHGRVELHFVICRPSDHWSEAPRPPFRWVEREALKQYVFPEGNRQVLTLLTSQ